MDNIYKVVTGIIILIVLSYSSSYSQSISLDSCHTKARNNYPLIKQLSLIERSNDYSLSNANKNYLPQLSISLVGGVIDGLPSFSQTSESSSTEFNFISVVQLNQNIWDGGVTKAQKEMTQANTNVDKADIEVSLYELEDRVNNLYFGILLIEEQIDQLVLLQNTLGRNLKRVSIAVENGTAYSSDFDEIKVEMINTAQKMDELQFNRKAYTTLLSTIIGEEINEDDSLFRPEMTADILTSEINRPELSLFQHQQRLIEAQQKLNTTSLYPKIGLLGFGTFIEPGVNFGVSKLTNIVVAGLNVSWDIGGLYKNGNNKRITELSLQKVEVQKETFLFNTNLQLAQSNHELDKYRSLIDKDKELLSLKSRIKDSYELKYDNGVSTMSEFLDRINDENRAKQDLIMHEIQYLMAAYQYKNASGN